MNCSGLAYPLACEIAVGILNTGEVSRRRIVGLDGQGVDRYRMTCNLWSQAQGTGRGLSSMRQGAATGL
jgi:hypothetical protein